MLTNSGLPYASRMEIFISKIQSPVRHAERRCCIFDWHQDPSHAQSHRLTCHTLLILILRHWFICLVTFPSEEDRNDCYEVGDTPKKISVIVREDIYLRGMQLPPIKHYFKIDGRCDDSEDGDNM